MYRRNAKQLADEIETLHSDLVKIEDELASNPDYRPQVASVCSRLVARQAQLTELSTRRLIRLTWGLVIFSIALLAVALAQTKIMFDENVNTLAACSGRPILPDSTHQ